MNTNPKATKILCYGDSNTWGFIPVTKERYPADIRWTGVLQKILGGKFEIIEEGLNSRTTNIDDPNNIGRNGKTYLIPCLHTYNPINLVVLMLGTNDLKTRLNRTLNDIESGIRELIDIITHEGVDYNGNAPKIVLMSPPFVDEKINEKFLGGSEKANFFPALYERIAMETNCLFVNTQEFLVPSEKDGTHFEPEYHKKLAQVIAKKVENII
jgi:lysophospholipase L1-like esterase